MSIDITERMKMGRTKIAGIATVAALALFATANHNSERPPKADVPSIASGAGPIRSARLRDLPPAPRTGQLRWPVRAFRHSAQPGAPLQPILAPNGPFAGALGLLRRSGAALTQLVLPSLGAIPATDKNFDGIGQGFSGPAGTFTVNAAPPDTNGDVGPSHYVQIVNTDFAVFDKNGVPLYGPVPINTLWS